jgi:hypothetical protein
VILGLRVDFYGRCLDYPELAPMVTAGQTPVRPMTREELGYTACAAVFRIVTPIAPALG